MAGKGQGSGGYFNNAKQGIDDLMGQGSNINMRNQARNLRNFEEAVQKSSRHTTDGIKNTARQAQGAIRGFLDQMNKETKEAVKNLGKSISKMFLDIKKAKDQATNISPMAPSKGKRGRGGGHGFFDDFSGDASRKIKNEIGQITSAFMHMLPAITAIGGAAAFVVTIFERIVGLEKDTRDILIASGGASKSVNQFTQSVASLSRELNISQDQLFDLSNAYLDAGLSVGRLDSDMTKFLKSTAMSMRIFNVNEQDAAKYFTTINKGGGSFQSMGSDIAESVKQMTMLGITTRDVAQAFNDANYAYSQYGGILGKNIKDFKSGFMGMKSLFKAMNMDADKAAGAYGNFIGDIGNRMRQSAFISSLSGMSNDAAFRALSDPVKGTKLRMTGGMQMVAQMMGGLATTLGTDQSKLSDAQYRKSQIARSSAIDAAVGAGFDKDMLLENLALFQQQAVSRGGVKNKSDLMQQISNFVPDMVAKQENNPVKTIADVVSGLKGTTQELLTQINNSINEGITKFAVFVKDKMTPMIRHISDFVVTEWPRFMKLMEDTWGWVNSMVSPIQNIANTIYELIKSLMNPFQKAGEWVGGMFDPFGASKSAQGSGMAEALSRWNKTRAPMGKAGIQLGFAGNKGSGGLMDSVRAVHQAALQRGVDPLTAIATMLTESRGNARAAGDPGIFRGGKFISSGSLRKMGMDPKAAGAQPTSFGLFQLHKGGKLGSMTPEQAFNPHMNAMVALKEFGRLQKLHPDWDAGQIAAAAQRPADPSGYRRKVNGNLGRASELLAQLGSGGAVPGAPPPPSASDLASAGSPGVMNIGNTSIGRGLVAPPAAMPVTQKVLEEILEQSRAQTAMLKKELDSRDRAMSDIKKAMISRDASSQNLAAHLTKGT